MADAFAELEQEGAYGKKRIVTVRAKDLNKAALSFRNYKEKGRSVDCLPQPGGL